MLSSFFLKSATHDEIHDILSNQKDGGDGHDHINVIFAKYISSVISNCQANVINLSVIWYCTN